MQKSKYKEFLALLMAAIMVLGSVVFTVSPITADYANDYAPAYTQEESDSPQNDVVETDPVEPADNNEEYSDDAEPVNDNGEYHNDNEVEIDDAEPTDDNDEYNR